MASTHKLKIFVSSSHPAHLSWVRDLLQHPDVEVMDAPGEGIANVIIDVTFGWTLAKLAQLDSIARARTLIVTSSMHPVYLDCLGSHHVSSVASMSDPQGILAGAYAAAAAQRSYHYRSPLTYMELRVLRLLLKGVDTVGVAAALDVSFKTVNAHVSNTLGKMGVDGRAQMLVNLLGGAPNDLDAWDPGEDDEGHQMPLEPAA